MKTLIPSCTSIAVLAVALCGCKQKPPPTPEAPAQQASTPTQKVAQAEVTPVQKTSFAEVTSQLDPGGSVYAYLSTEQWMSGLSTNIAGWRDVFLGLPDIPQETRGQAGKAFELIGRLVETSGLENLKGVGVSGIQIADGMYRTKFIAHHGAGAGDGFFWTLFGKQTHSLDTLAMLPQHTALAGFWDINFQEAWQVIEKQLSQSGIPPVEEATRQWPETFQKKTQMSWPDLLDSLGGEMGFLLTLNPTNTIKVPAGEEKTLDVPSPALLFAIKVKNDLLYDHISQQLQANPQVISTNEPGFKYCAMPLPLPLPVQVVVATSGDYFFFASSVDLVRSVLSTRDGKTPGFQSTPDYNEMAKYLPKEGNQFFYASAAFSETVSKIQQQFMQAQQMPEAQRAVLEKLVWGRKPRFGMSVGGHTEDGWRTVSVGNQNPATVLVAMPAAATAGVLGALALPALAKAKGKAQTIQSVNQLKQIGLAARIYATDNNDKYPPAENWCDALQQYLGDSTKILKSPTDQGSGACSYAYNAKLSGMSDAKINPQTVAFFETEAGWNQHGGRELMISQPRSNGMFVIGFADGSVQMIAPDRVDTLRWVP